MSELAFNDWAAQHRERVEAALARSLPSGELQSSQLLEAIRYSALGGGKRLRALLSYASAEAVGASAEIADHTAVAVELIHAYSLVHDDLPCMDDDALRRGKPTNHVVYGEATAMLVGDALQPLAFDVLLQAPASPEGVLVANRALANAAGVHGMVGGQAIDLANVGKPMDQTALEQMHAMKTGAMFEAAVLLPALLTLQSELVRVALRDYARNIGLAFQVLDDVLDATADSATLGKTAGKDAAQDKPTFVSLMGVDAARAYAQQLTAEAVEALGAMAILSPLDAEVRCARLQQLANTMLDRKA